jgi:hypothetical protein
VDGRTTYGTRRQLPNQKNLRRFSRRLPSAALVRPLLRIVIEISHVFDVIVDWKLVYWPLIPCAD